MSRQQRRKGMYGTMFRMRIKEGHEEQVMDLFRQWDQERRPKAEGTVGGFLLKPDRRPGELVGMVIFQDKQTYRANADDPEQDQWYRSLLEHLEGEPEWEDGEYFVSTRPEMEAMT